MRLEMVTAVRTNAFQAPSLKQHENGLRSVEDAHRHAQRLARQQPQPQLQLQQQRGAPRGGQQPSPRGFPGVAGPAKQPVDAGETFQRPSPGDSNNSETTASTPPTVSAFLSNSHAGFKDDDDVCCGWEVKVSGGVISKKNYAKGGCAGGD